MVILFDLDGTLIDSTEAILEGFDVAFSTYNRNVPSDILIQKEIGYPLDVMFATLGIPQEEIESHVIAYKEHYRKISCAKTQLLPNAREAVILASKHATLGVATTKTAKYSIELLEHMNLMQYFDALIGREDVTHPKPHPEPILKALSALSTEAIDKKECWMIGDTPMDIQAANAAKIQSVGVTCGYAQTESLRACTSNIYDSALEAVKYIVKELD